MPPLTLALISCNVLMYLMVQAAGPGFFGAFALWPLGSGLFQPWQVASYAFLHGSLTHLAFNMFGLWVFGPDLERLWGPRRFAIVYSVSVATAACAQMVLAGATGDMTPLVGASGGIFGLMTGYAMVFPQRTIVLLFPPIPMPARIFVVLYGVIELTLGVTGLQGGVAHFAHLGGLLGGWLAIRSLGTRTGR